MGGKPVENVQQAIPRSGVFYTADQRFGPLRQFPGIVSMIRLPLLRTNVPLSAERLRPVPVVTTDLRPIRDLADQRMVADLHAQCCISHCISGSSRIPPCNG